MVGGIISGGNPIMALAGVISKKEIESQAPGWAQHLWNLSKKPYEKTNLNRGNPITPMDKSGIFNIPYRNADVQVPNVNTEINKKLLKQPKVKTPTPKIETTKEITKESIKKPKKKLEIPLPTE